MFLKTVLTSVLELLRAFVRSFVLPTKTLYQDYGTIYIKKLLGNVYFNQGISICRISDICYLDIYINSS